MSEQDLSEMSVAELTRILNSRKSELTKLEKKRETYLNKLQNVEEKIKALEGEYTPQNGRTGPRPKNDKRLHDYAVEILSKYKKGLPVAELAEKVLKAGYKTNSSDFKNTVYQCLYKSNEIVKDETTDNYVLA